MAAGRQRTQNDDRRGERFEQRRQDHIDEDRGDRHHPIVDHLLVRLDDFDRIPLGQNHVLQRRSHDPSRKIQTRLGIQNLRRKPVRNHNPTGLVGPQQACSVLIRPDPRHFGQRYEMPVPVQNA